LGTVKRSTERLTPAEAATALGVSVWTVYRMTDDGRLRDVLRVGKKMRLVSAAEVQKILGERTESDAA
jgi:excisionase family DNA binding protein